MPTSGRPFEATLDLAGCPIAYRVQGAGPPAVFIQGVGVHGDGWGPQVDGLAGQFRCLTFDNRGMGASVPAAAPVTVERMAADTLALLDHLGWESAHVVGHSLGGQVAVELALAARTRVRSLALLCTFHSGGDAVAMTPAKIWTGLRTWVGTRRMRRRAFLEMIVPPATLASADRDRLAADLAPLFGHDLADHPAIEMAQLRALSRYDARARLRELAGLPTVVVAGSEDRIAPPASGRALAAAIPGARYLEIFAAAHGLPIAEAVTMNTLLAAHFAGA